MYREGKTVTQIADTLRVSRATVYRHIGESEAAPTSPPAPQAT